ncbi:MAG: ABC transporter substrate-binding protein, partial [Rhizobium sp.]|nr:ABC transporter substrate-binding protein [Rhizobium sp.]
MLPITRRHTLGLFGATAGSLILPRMTFAQGKRPSVTIAVQKITNNNTLCVWNEQSNVGERVFFPNLWEGLINRDWMGNQGPVAGLATEWKRIDDKTLELKLRQGVKFHNGDELTADDVVFSFSKERVFGNTEPKGGKTIFEADHKPTTVKELPAAVPGIGRRLWPALAGVEAVDKYTVRFHNATPDVTLEGRLYAYGSQIANRRAWDEAGSYADWARKPVTTGPYQVGEYKPDVSLTLVAFDEYWGGRPPLEEIRFVEVPEVASRVNGLLSGEYDFACDLPPDQIATVQAASGFEVQGSTILNHRVSVFNTQNEILANPLVRRAMTHAIDRQAIVDALWGGQTVIPAGLQFDIFKTTDMFIDGWAAPDYNPELARDLLKQANYKGDAIPYRLLNNYYTNQTANGQIMVEMWKQVGLNVEIQMKENWAQIHDPEGVKGVRDW